MELAFASLHQLCAPMLNRLGPLPDPQRQALEIVFGLSAGAAPDRFLVGLAVLGLLSEVTDERPLLCVVDDAQWLDHASALTLAFVARRLQAEPVGIVFAAREPGDELQHLPELTVGGLADGAARALLDSTVRFVLRRGSDRVAGPRSARTPFRARRAADGGAGRFGPAWGRTAGEARRRRAPFRIERPPLAPRDIRPPACARTRAVQSCRPRPRRAARVFCRRPRERPQGAGRVLRTRLFGL